MSITGSQHLGILTLFTDAQAEKASPLGTRFIQSLPETSQSKIIYTHPVHSKTTYL
jgi:hypothetical protein